MKFSKSTCIALHLGRNNPIDQSMLEAKWLESNFTERLWGSLGAPS